MVNKVNFPPAYGGDGKDYTDDSDPGTGMGNGGFRTRLLPLLANIINIANWILAQVTFAVQSANSAAESAASAVSAPGTSATSTTSLTIGAGSRTLTVQTGKLFVVGMYVTVASTDSPANLMTGTVTAYNNSTGALTVSVVSVSGSGTFATWTVALSGSPGATGATGQSGQLLPYIHVRDQKASGQSGGSSVAGTQTRVLNTVVTNTIPGASLASNLITLPAGTYRIQANAPAYAVSVHQASLYNSTDAVSLVAGTNEVANPSYPHITRSFIIGSFVLTAAKAVSISHYMATAVANNGLGPNVSSGLGEVYTEVEITKVA